MKSVSQILREERLQQGISLDDVSQKTYIKLHYLEALEGELLDDLPAPVFTCGYIRQYAKLLGLNGADLVSHFQQEIESRVKPRQQDNMPEQPTDMFRPPQIGDKYGNGIPDSASQPPSNDVIDQVLDALSESTPVNRSAVMHNSAPTLPMQQPAQSPMSLSNLGRPLPAEADNILYLARREAEEIVNQAREEARRLRQEARQYADGVLLELEQEVSRSLSTVRNGRLFLQQKSQERRQEALEAMARLANREHVVPPTIPQE